MKLCGGFIDRFEPNVDEEDGFLSSKIEKGILKFAEYHEAFITFPYFDATYSHSKEMNHCINKFWKYEIVVTKEGRISLSELVKTVDRINDELVEREDLDTAKLIALAEIVLDSFERKEEKVENY